MKFGAAQKVALGGVLAALAMVVMALGGMIPLTTYICPAVCMVMCYIVMRLCGKRVAWAWYAVVAILSLLLGPDKEAAGVFLFFGFYPILKTVFERFRFGVLLKFVYFNTATVVLYLGMIYLFGFTQLLTEFGSMGMIGLAVMVLLGNLTFYLADRLLRILSKRF